MTIYYQNIRLPIVNQGKTTLGLLAMAAVLILAIFYLIQVNVMIMENYQMRDLRVKIKELREENQQLQVQAAQIKSLPYLKTHLEGFNMITVDKINYLKNSGAEMALAE